ncbi:hypothetical protein GOP47_0021643 [Adiantum capillus-veneris]|uniref:Sel1 repeat family protein n=1 Tax=Adiantum capillus-veneris TaxID=13818 RepID=A0A9D4U7U3_ADICA|nr:hypothetical protein GOP47_0021643 [Adiantum capillus-veneris]
MSLRAARLAPKQRILFAFLAALIILLLSGTSVSARKNQRKLVLIFNDQEARKAGRESLNAEASSAPSDDATQEASDQQDDFNDPDDFRLEDLDPGSWKIIAEGYANGEPNEGNGSKGEEDASMAAAQALYIAGVRKLLDAVSAGDPDGLSESVDRFQKAAQAGHAHAQSTLAFLYRSGIGVEHNGAKAFLYHSFAAGSGNYQSKLALAYSYFHQQVFSLFTFVLI